MGYQTHVEKTEEIDRLERKIKEIKSSLSSDYHRYTEQVRLLSVLRLRLETSRERLRHSKKRTSKFRYKL